MEYTATKATNLTITGKTSYIISLRKHDCSVAERRNCVTKSSGFDAYHLQSDM